MKFCSHEAYFRTARALELLAVKNHLLTSVFGVQLVLHSHDFVWSNGFRFSLFLIDVTTLGYTNFFLKSNVLFSDKLSITLNQSDSINRLFMKYNTVDFSQKQPSNFRKKFVQLGGLGRIFVLAMIHKD